MTKETIGFVATIVALLTALISLSAAFVTHRGLSVQQKRIDDQGAQLEQLRALAARTALDITIQKPRHGENIPPVFDSMGGSFRGTIPIGYKLWVLAKDRYNYFLMYPPTQFVMTEQRWAQTNVRLATAGDWELLVCLANSNASAWLQGRASANDWGGFPALPDGLEILRTVSVRR